MSNDLKDHISGPALKVAAKVIEALEAQDTSITLDWGTFYVRRIEIAWTDGHDSDPCLILAPNEADGETFDAWTPKRG